MNQIALFITSNNRFFDPLNVKNCRFHKDSLIISMNLEEFIYNYESRYFHEELSEIIINPDEFIKFIDGINEIMKNIIFINKDIPVDLNLNYELNEIDNISYELTIYDKQRKFQIIFINIIFDINLELRISIQSIKNDYHQMKKLLMRKIKIPKFRVL